MLPGCRGRKTLQVHTPEFLHPSGLSSCLTSLMSGALGYSSAKCLHVVSLGSRHVAPRGCTQGRAVSVRATFNGSTASRKTSVE